MAMQRGLALLVLVILLTPTALLVGCHGLDRTPAPATAEPSASRFDAARLLVLVDGDMAATAYADGELHPIAGARDLLVRLDAPGGEPTRTEVPASNTVMGWPGAMTVGPGERFAHVVESRGSVDRSVEAVGSVHADMPVGRRLTTVDLATGEVAAAREVCRRPMSVDRAPGGAWLLVACADAGGELAVVPLEGGLPGEPRVLDLDLPDPGRSPRDEGLTYAVVHPSGRAAGVIADNGAVALVRLELDAAGVPVAAEAEALTLAGDWLSVARWTAAGDHLLVADVGWGPRPLDAVLNGPGAILSLALSPDDDRRGVVSEARVGKSPEAFELNRDGTLLAAVNMERTYLPGGLLSLVPGRGASSLSLVAVDSGTGRLETLGDPMGFRGVLPEDAVFDADGDQLAVVVYQDHGEPRSGGWVEFFAVAGEGADRRPVPTGRRVPLPRGAHDLFVID